MFNHFMYMYDIKLSSKIKKNKNWRLLQIIRIYIQYIGIEFVIE